MAIAAKTARLDLGAIINGTSAVRVVMTVSDKDSSGQRAVHAIQLSFPANPEISPE
ncbi:MAG: hypothetical protein ACP5MD_15390 [Verrucomicrobiia bacterium]